MKHANLSPPIIVGCACVLLFSGCSRDIDADSLVGVYSSEDASSKIVLQEGGGFVGESLPGEYVMDDPGLGALSFEGSWDYVESAGGMQGFVYVSPDSSSGLDLGGFQFYIAGDNSLFLQPDPDDLSDRILFEQTN